MRSVPDFTNKYIGRSTNIINKLVSVGINAKSTNLNKSNLATNEVLPMHCELSALCLFDESSVIQFFKKRLLYNFQKFWKICSISHSQFHYFQYPQFQFPCLWGISFVFFLSIFLYNNNDDEIFTIVKMLENRVLGTSGKISRASRG